MTFILVGRYKLWVNLFRLKIFPAFFNYYMKYYLKLQNSKHFKVQSFQFSVVLKTSKFYNFFQKLHFFWNYRKIKIFLYMISHHIVELDELTRKMYTVMRFQIVFNKIIEENWKNLSRNKLFHKMTIFLRISFYF